MPTFRNARVAPVDQSITARLEEENRELSAKVKRLTEENAALTAELQTARDTVTELSAGVGISTTSRELATENEELKLINAEYTQYILKLCEEFHRRTARIQALTLKLSELRHSIRKMQSENAKAFQEYTQTLNTTSSKLSALEAVFNEIEERLTCPITHSLFEDPYISKYGDTFEEADILTWTQAHGTCPLSRRPLQSRMLIPDRTVKNIAAIVRDFKSKGRDY